MRAFFIFLTVGSLIAVLAPPPAPVAAADDKDDGVYQIVKSTTDRVWRLNKMTGEIAVCTLDGDNLVCTTSTKAITPPARTYEQREAEKTRAAAAEEERRQIEKAKDLEFLDRALMAFRILIGAAIERDSGK